MPGTGRFHRGIRSTPPRFGTILSYTDFIDWKTFIASKLEEDLKLKADASRARGARAVSSHSDAPAIMLSPLSGFGNPDDWWMTRSVDYYGTSIYPKHAAAATPWSPVRLTSALDGIRSAAGDRGWWIGELQAGQGATGVRVAPPVTGADLRLWGWASISRGARAICYYAWYPMSSGYESNGYGMIDLDGTITDRARIAGEFAGVVGRNASLFAPLRPHPSRVAILYNRLSYLVGGNTVAPGTVVRNSMLGIYRALFEQNIQVDFIHPDDVVSGAASKYSVVYLSYPVMLQQTGRRGAESVRARAAARSSAKRVRRGTTSVESPTREFPAVDSIRPLVPANASCDPASPSPSRWKRTSTARSPRSVDEASTASRLPNISTPAMARVVLARFPGEGAAGRARRSWNAAQGSGRAILIGTFPSAAFEQDPDKMRATGEFLQAADRRRRRHAGDPHRRRRRACRSTLPRILRCHRPHCHQPRRRRPSV